jgi:glycosyltransferase involved in cell wall biosynthesis
MQTIGIYSPYLDSLGGGERYFFTLAQCLQDKYKVEIIWKSKEILYQVEERFHLQLEKVAVNTKDYNVFQSKNFFKKFFLMRKYAGFFFLSDGSIPFLFAKNNFIHFQVPFKNKNKGILQQLKFFLIKDVFCNSKFTKQYIDKQYGLQTEVIYPPVDVDLFQTLKKENIILSVGRFDNLEQNKKQEEMIKAFKKLQQQGYQDWKLIIAGGINSLEGEKHFKHLNGLADDKSIELKKNVSFKTLTKLYAKAKIYWHAAGFEEDLAESPRKAEHFGITTVEAMASGCVPVVISAGGQKEIISDGENGFLWKTTAELIEKTTKIIDNLKLRNKLYKQAVKDSGKYSKKRFCSEINSLLRND